MRATTNIRCRCGALLARASGDYVIEIKCRRCGTLVRTERAPSPQQERPGASEPPRAIERSTR
ncbi:MAG: Com family DNA-binding transcriptional regulator [Tagaea sp.]|nr:Com family DNA-binding transcriptional regulator [Tagaea sp.]